MKRFLRISILAFFLLCTALSWGATPIPPNPKTRLLVSGVSGNFTNIFPFVSSYKSLVGAEFWALVVKSCDNDADQYATSVVDTWGVGQGKLDPGRHVLLVVCQENGLLGVHTGTEFALLGLDGKALSKAIIDGNAKISEYAKTPPYGPAEAVRLSILAAERLLRNSVEENLTAKENAKEQVLLAQETLKNTQDLLTKTREQCGVQDPLAKDSLETRIEEATLWLYASPKEAIQIANDVRTKAENAKKVIEQTCEQDSVLAAKVTQVETKLAALQENVPIKSGEDAAAKEAITGIELALQEVKTAREKGEYSRANDALAHANALLAIGSFAIVEGSTIARYRSLYVPGIILLSLLLFLVLLLVQFRRSASIWKTNAKNTVQVYGLRVEDFNERSKQFHLAYVSLLEGPQIHDKLAGETKNLYEKVGEQVDLLRALLGKANERLKTAKANISARSFFSSTQAKEAIKCLEHGEVEILYGAEISSFVVMLREKRISRKRTARLLDEIALLFPTVTKGLESLRESMSLAGSATKSAQKEIDQAKSLYEEILSLGVSPSIAQNELSRLEHELGEMKKEVESDPISVANRVPTLKEAAYVLRQRLETTLLLTKQIAQELSINAEKVWSHIQELRQKGLKLREASFDPASIKQEFDQANGKALSALNALDFEKAKQEITRMEQTLDSLQSGVEKSLLSRDVAPGEIESLTKRLEQLQEKVTKVRSLLEQIAEKNETHTLRVLLEQLGRYPLRMSRLAQLLVEAKHRWEETLFLAAAEKRTQIADKLDTLEKFLADLLDQDKLDEILQSQSFPTMINTNPDLAAVSKPKSAVASPTLPPPPPKRSAKKRTPVPSSKPSKQASVSSVSEKELDATTLSLTKSTSEGLDPSQKLLLRASASHAKSDGKPKKKAKK